MYIYQAQERARAGSGMSARTGFLQGTGSALEPAVGLYPRLHSNSYSESDLRTENKLKTGSDLMDSGITWNMDFNLDSESDMGSR